MGLSRRQVFGRQDGQVGEGGAQSAGVKWACFGGKDLAPNGLKVEDVEFIGSASVIHIAYRLILDWYLGCI